MHANKTVHTIEIEAREAENIMQMLKHCLHVYVLVIEREGQENNLRADYRTAWFSSARAFSDFAKYPEQHRDDLRGFEKRLEAVQRKAEDESKVTA